jgi:hypothetical protein
MSKESGNPFSLNKADLGVTDLYRDRSSVDLNFNQSYLDLPYEAKCCVCGQPPIYQLIPKPSSGIPQANPEDSMVCNHHLQLFSKDLYGIRELKQ